MNPKELEDKLRNFFAKELHGNFYQCVLTYSDGKPNPSNQQSITLNTVMVGNANPSNTPFAIFHGLMRTMELQVRSLIVSIYGGEIKPEVKEKPPNYYG
ncbi:MAG: hypothetical protein WC488_03265 [Candidatus Micrarchaeia archaeon]